LIKEKGYEVEKCQKVILKNVFGKITEVDTLSRLTLEMRGRIITKDFLSNGLCRKIS
jgi:hypothetical protein